MILKYFGVILIVGACGGMGFQIAANYRAEEKSLRQLISILEYMECELQYRLTSLPQLCRKVAKQFSSTLSEVFYELAMEMESQISADIAVCMTSALKRVSNIPLLTVIWMERLGKSIGQFDLDGQIRGLEAIRQECKRNLESLADNRENKLRSYQTLGLCAGAAIVILFV